MSNVYKCNFFEVNCKESDSLGSAAFLLITRFSGDRQLMQPSS